MTNTLYYGDNLAILREHIARESVDLVYLDPPFNSNASYNVLFKAPDGHDSHAQMEAFDDTWHWGGAAEQAFDDVLRSGNTDAAEMLRAMRSFLKENDMMAYLAMMAVRLIELHRVLKPTGSLYLHCDPTASHYLKVLLDAVFGPENFINEIVWRRYSRPKGSQFKARKFGNATDTILFYAKSASYTFDLARVSKPLTDEVLDQMYAHQDAKGRYMSGPMLRSASMGARPNLVFEYKSFTPGPAGWRMTKEKVSALDAAGDLYWTATGQPRRKVRPRNQPGTLIDSLWTDIDALGSQAQERLGYPTQKPLALLERIVAASSNEGDVVLDPFCGCGTTVHAAQKMNRRWIGIDVTHLAISLIQKRLRDAFGHDLALQVVGVPRDVAGAAALAAQDKYQFQWWAVSLVDAVPFGGRKKGADGGIDGIIYVKPDLKRTEKVIVSVKGGEAVNVAMVRDLKAVVERERAAGGVLITLADPTGPMTKEAIIAGDFEIPEIGRKYPKIQIRTIRDLFEGRQPDLPYIDRTVFRKAQRERTERQGKLI